MASNSMDNVKDDKYYLRKIIETEYFSNMIARIKACKKEFGLW